MNDLVWDRRMLGAFKAFSILTEEEEIVLEDWAKGKSIVNTSMMHNLSPRTVSRIRQRLRVKYDRIQPYTDLPKRGTRS